MKIKVVQTVVSFLSQLFSILNFNQIDVFKIIFKNKRGVYLPYYCTFNITLGAEIVGPLS